MAFTPTIHPSTHAPTSPFLRNFYNCCKTAFTPCCEQSFKPPLCLMKFGFQMFFLKVGTSLVCILSLFVSSNIIPLINKWQEINWYDNLFRSPTILLSKHILQTIYIRLYLIPPCFSRNTQALGHNPVPHLSHTEKGWQTAPIATIISNKFRL